MQLDVAIYLQEPLVLPLNYNHIIQSIIYRALSAMPDYSEFLHEYGYGNGSRQYKMFQFSQLNGDYYVEQKHRKIVFRSYVTFEVRSPEPLLINLLAMSFQHQGITFGTMNCRDIHLELFDYTVEETELLIRMKTPLTLYSTDYDTKRTYFYSPEEPEFYQKIVDNFRRKYEAFYGVRSFQPITLTYIGEKLPQKLGKLISTVLPQCKTSLSNDALTKLTLSMARCKIEDSQAYPFKSEDERYNGIYYGFPITAQTNVKKAHEYLFGTKDYKPTEELQKISAKIKVVTDYIGITE